jgi:predicted transcriptional regulator
MKKATVIKYLEYASLCKLKAKEYKVLLFIFSELIDLKYSSLNQNKIAEQLGLTKSDVSKSLRRLEENQILRFIWTSPRKKLVGFEPYTDDELDELITEKVEGNVDNSFFDDWDD